MNHSIYHAALRSFVEEGHLSSSCLGDSNSSLADPLVAPLKSLLLQGRIPEMTFAQTLSRLHQIPLVLGHDFPESPVAETEPLSDFFKEHEVLPLALNENQLQLAMVDPADDFVLQVLRSKLRCEVQPHIALRSELLSALMRLYFDKQDFPQLTTNTQDVPEDIESQSRLVRELHQVLQRGIAIGASDIHFEPQQQALGVRYRIAGVLQQAHSFSSEDALSVLARIKVMARLDVTQRRLPQDGRFKFPADGQLLDLRVSTMPLHNGESVVVRLLDSSLGNLSLAELGYRDTVAAALEKAVERQQGMVLVTGPTGSGKSTTLYSLLNRLNQPDRKIISIENPVEMVLPGVNQIQVDEAHGISFVSALRSVLRQDPDVIMVGEIRDAETAKLAAQAALTGHLVLSTLHTASAMATVTRLRDLGLADYLISATLSTVVAQRLVRVSCLVCASDKPSTSCRSCYGTGYSGRTTIAELLERLDGVDLSLSKPDLEAALESQLLNQMTLKHDALRLLEKEVVDQAEVMRVLGTEVSLP